MPNWLELVPHDIAVRQIAWERRKSIARAHERAGVSLADIASHYGVSAGRAGQLYRGRSRLATSEESPVERYLRMDREDLRALSEKPLAPSRTGRFLADNPTTIGETVLNAVDENLRISRYHKRTFTFERPDGYKFKVTVTMCPT